MLYQRKTVQIYIIGNVIIFLIVKTMYIYPLFADENKYLNTIMCEEGQRCHLEKKTHSSDHCNKLFL